MTPGTYRTAPSARRPTSIQIGPGESRDVFFTAPAAGTYAVLRPGHVALHRQRRRLRRLGRRPAQRDPGHRRPRRRSSSRTAGPARRRGHGEFPRSWRSTTPPVIAATATGHRRPAGRPWQVHRRNGHRRLRPTTRARTSPTSGGYAATTAPATDSNRVELDDVRQPGSRTPSTSEWPNQNPATTCAGTGCWPRTRRRLQRTHTGADLRRADT